MIIGRLCGILCCDLCSNKKLYIKPLVGATTTISSNKIEKERICDCCFNKVNADVISWFQITMKIKKEQEKVDLQNAKESPSKNLLFESNNSNSKEKNKIEAVTGVMNDTMKVLTERGEKIKELANKGEELNEVLLFDTINNMNNINYEYQGAADFNRMTKLLLQKTKSRNAKYGGY